jgi:hypothetical protein
MKGKIFFLQVVACAFICKFCFAQGTINNYPFGYTGPLRGNMDIFSGTPVITSDSLVFYKFSYSHANLSDSLGNLLFSTNGVVVFENNYDTMPNGTGLNPCSYTSVFQYGGLPLPQADLILPDPGDSSQYYLIHQSADQYPVDYTNKNIYYSKINMQLNNGKGDISQKNIFLYQDLLWPASVTACKHANGRDWWIIFLRAYLPDYLIFLLTPNGITYQSTQTIGARWDCGQAAFSNDGRYYGLREGGTNFQIFDFDRCTGTFSNARIILTNDSNWGIGFCFSPNSKLAYGASAHYLYQVNLDSANLLTSLDTVAKWDSTYDPIFGPPVETGFEFMQIGPDGKIYMTTVWATHYMQYINYPDSAGVACGMQQHALLLATPNGNTIPNFVNYFLGPVIGSICDSLGLGIPENAIHNFKFSIQPNPITDKTLLIKYVLPPNKEGTLEVFDIMGKSLFKEVLPPWSTEQHYKLQLAAGMYTVKITSNKQQAVQKMLIQ